MDLAHIMTPSPATLDVTATVADAMELLYTLDVRHLPIVDDRRLVGMLSDRDLQGLAMASTGGAPEQLAAGRYLEQSIGDVMSSSVVAVQASDELADVVDTMLEHKVGALPVVDAAGALVGIVSYVDLLRAWREDL